MKESVTREEVRLWRKELEKLQGQVRDLEQKLKAAALLGLTDTEEADSGAEPEPQESQAEGVPAAILRVLRETGVPMNAMRIRRTLLEEGFDDSRFGTNLSYLYTALGRLMKRGKVRKIGSKYRATK